MSDHLPPGSASSAETGNTTNATHGSGGADLNVGRDITIGGDVVGRDKYVNIAMSIIDPHQSGSSMPIKKCELYSSIWTGCDTLRSTVMPACFRLTLRCAMEARSASGNPRTLSA